MSPKHDHPEAFHLLYYRADNNPAQHEMVWNSRDGAVPLVIPLRAGGTASHVTDTSDVYAPHHRPAVGDRIFVDLTEERAWELAHANAQEFFERPDEFGDRARETYKSQEAMAAFLERSYLDEVHRGAAEVVEVTTELARERGWL